MMAASDSIPGKSPAFQFYPKDFITDERVALMSMQERGVYITLICKCWTEGTLPAEDSLLARLCGLPQATFRKLWPAIAPCFRAHPSQVNRLVHPRLEKERQKQRAFRRRQADNGRLGGRPRNPEKPKPFADRGNVQTQSEAKKSSSSAISDLQSASADFRQTVPASIADARSKRPIFKGQRFVVFEWMLDDLRRMLGTHVEAFDLHAWFFELDSRAAAQELAVPQRDGGQWLQQQTLAEAVRRGIPVSAAATVGKTAGNLAAAAAFVARGRR